MFVFYSNKMSGNESSPDLDSDEFEYDEQDDDGIVFENKEETNDDEQDDDGIVFESEETDDEQDDDGIVFESEEIDDDEQDTRSPEEKIISNYKTLSMDKDIDEVIKAFHNIYTTEEPININEIKYDQEETICLKTSDEQAENSSCRVTFNNDVKVFYTYSTKHVTRSNTYYVDLERYLRTRIGTRV